MTSCASTSACDTIGGVLLLESPAPSPAGDVERLPGRGRLRIVRAGDRSVVTRAYATSPLRLLTPANHGSAAWIYTSSYGGGFVDGDRVEIDVEVAEGAAAFVSTQAATKVYRSPAGTSFALRARVDAGGLLALVPDPVVCFAGARYHQYQQFAVHEAAGLVVVDWMVSGRCASGERWAFSDYRSLIEVTVGGRLVAHDSMALRAADGDLASRLGRFDVLAAVVIAGSTLQAAASHVLDMHAGHAVERRASQLVAASPLAHGGCLVRVAGTSVERVGRTLRALLEFLPARLNDDPWRRKW
jgi:urease accessory protein